MPDFDVTTLKILIVEDNPHFRKLIFAILEALGMTDLEEARDGLEAIEVLRQERADLVIMDWKMEGIDGVESVRRIRSLDNPCRTVPIIMVTGYTESSLRKSARAAGVNDFLGKPISAQSLLNRIVSVMAHPRPFYETADYFGPDRRYKQVNPSGPERRKLQIPPVESAE